MADTSLDNIDAQLSEFAAAGFTVEQHDAVDGDVATGLNLPTRLDQPLKEHTYSEMPFMNFNVPSTDQLPPLDVPFNPYRTPNTADYTVVPIVKLPPGGIRLYDFLFGSFSGAGLPPLHVSGDPFSSKVSVRIRWPGYQNILAKDKQINIRRTTANSEYVHTQKVLEQIAKLFWNFMKDVENDVINVEWGLRPNGAIGFNHIFLQQILRVAHGSIQPVFSCQRFK
ncbi:uncharacterized protein LAESUDRAFT_751385 [Laetiporus sulphureus 93-53]|uniref:Uncharacterized protein n=1 Tax=Laetiporus sulphureus 93-53 TaxID=1314785 RepID=A0A165D1X1_9APHY|nr:uncharacterized protein LAESUDRAFT_751385 [Laetiporus sulphureus 93-53]KZT03988.1 hypothetical protein LAESUDRAFT_751385 [Laetiporus sulphureus 93-53]